MNGGQLRYRRFTAAGILQCLECLNEDQGSTTDYRAEGCEQSTPYRELQEDYLETDLTTPSGSIPSIAQGRQDTEKTRCCP